MNSLRKNYYVCLVVFSLMGCAGYSKFTEESQSIVDQTTTPRDILNARIVNRSEGSDYPFLTVGKFVELADRYQSCQCTNERFVRRWEKPRLVTFYTPTLTKAALSNLYVGERDMTLIVS